MPKQLKSCSYCGKSDLLRWPLNPQTKEPIKNFFCDTKCKGSWQTAQREALGFTKEWLISQYLTQGKSANQIAKEIGRDSKRVWEWIVNYGLDTRSRGHNYHKNLVMDGSSFRGKRHTDKTKMRLSELAKTDGRLPWGKNNEPYWKGKTGEKHPAFKGGLTPERQAVYSSQEWVQAVKDVWYRDNATCQHCGKHHNEAGSRGTFHIHHIISFQVKEFQTDVNNLVLLCKECHKFVHSKKNVHKIFIKEVSNG